MDSCLSVRPCLYCFLSHSSVFPLWGPPNGPCIESVLTSLFFFPFSQLSLSLYLDLCPSTHLGRICLECALSLLNGYFLVSVGAFERKLVRVGALLEIRGAWFLSVSDCRHFVEVTWSCTEADCSPSVPLPPACLSLFQSLKSAQQTQSIISFFKRLLVFERLIAAVFGSFRKPQDVLKNGYKRLLCAMDIKAGK